VPASGGRAHLPPAYWQACEGLPIGDYGCCPSAVLHNKISISEDLLIDEKWASARDVVAQLGMRSCWSVPVQDSHTREVIGTFAMYRAVPASPTPEDLRVVTAAAQLAGNAIERLRWAQRPATSKSASRWPSAPRQFGIWEWDPRTNVFDLSEGTARRDGRRPEGRTHHHRAAVCDACIPTIASGQRRRATRARRGGSYEQEFRAISPVDGVGPLVPQQRQGWSSPTASR
jgi:hypothetical protein